MTNETLKMNNSMQAILLNGIYPPVPTPFNDKERLEVSALQGNLSFLRQFDLRGFVVLGSNGESVMLSIEERLMVIEAARAVVPPDKLLIAGTGSQSTFETIAMTKAAASLGADAALVITPSYYRGLMTPEVLIKHFHSVADDSPIPVLLYNMPACTGIDMDAETIAYLARHPNIIGLKDSSGNVVKMASVRQQAGPGFQVLAGSGSFLLPALSIGAVGGIMALANIAPVQCVDLYRLFLEGKQKEAQEMQMRLLPVNDAVTSRWGVPALKAAMDALDMYGGPARTPLPRFSKENRKILNSILVRAGLKK
jgi:4-hydroxy-2-oxoglutarate aldolase